MKELKTYISEGFFSNVGANNRIKLVIDAIKDASVNDKINSRGKRHECADSLIPILKDVETLAKKGKFAFEYIRNDETYRNNTITISLKMTGSNDAKWKYIDHSSGRSEGFKWETHDIALYIADDLYYEAVYPSEDQKLRHSIANTIKVIEFKVS